MIFKKGIEVEVLENGKVSFGSWRPARILSGNGRSYVVKYDGCSLETAVIMNKVPRKALRPCPPPVEAKGWACGDVVEVFDEDSWNLAEVLGTLSCNMVVARLLGSSKEIEAPLCWLRIAQTWKDNQWVSFQKEDSVKCKKVLVNNQSKRRKVSFQMPLSSIEVQKCGRVDRIAELYDDCVDQWYQESLGRLKKRSRLCGPPAYALAGVGRKKKHIEKKLTGQLLRKVDAHSEKHMNAAINHETAGFCEKVIYCQYPIANAVSNIVASLDLSDNESTTASVGSCSVINGSCRSVHSMASPRQKLCGHPDDAESYCGSPTEPSHSRKDDMPEVIHDLELDAYSATLRSLFASGSLSWEQESLLTDLRLALNISDDEHRSQLKDLMSTKS